MPLRIPSPAVVLAAVLTSWSSGTVLYAAFTRARGGVQAGHFKVVWIASTGLALAAGIWHRPALVLAAVCAASFLAIYASGDLVFAGAAAAAGVVVLAVADVPRPFGLFVSGSSALLLGAVTNAMLLGHWHLNQPGLKTHPLMRLVYALWIGTAVFLASCAALLAWALGRPDAGAVVAGAATAVAFASFSAVLTGMVTYLVRTRSIMSATGILYLEVLLCFVAAFTGLLGALSSVDV